MTSKIDYSDFRTLRKIAMRFAKSRGYGDDAEDFAQEYCFAVWLEKNKSLHRQLVNYLRENYGRFDKWASKKDLAKNQALFRTDSYDDIYLEGNKKF